MCVRAFMRACVRACVHVCVRVCMYLCVHGCMCVFLYVYVCFTDKSALCILLNNRKTLLFSMLRKNTGGEKGMLQERTHVSTKDVKVFIQIYTNYTQDTYISISTCTYALKHAVY